LSLFFSRVKEALILSGRTREVKRERTSEPGFGAALMVGLLGGLVMFVASFWFSPGPLKATAVTIILFWSVTGSFRSRWNDRRFWMIVALLFAIHTIMIAGVVGKIANMGIYPLMALVFPEMIVMVIVIMLTGSS
jgi:hypothetical protein